MQKPKILLIFCPIWDVCAPYASLAYLAGSLKGKVDVTIWDLNIEMQDLVLSNEYASRTFAEIQQTAYNEEVFHRAELLFYLVKDRIDAAKDLLRTETNTYQQRKVANKILHYARTLISLKYFPARFTESDFFFDQETRFPDLASLKKNLNNRRINIFLDIFLDSFVEQLDKTPFQLIGASLVGVNQIAATLSILNQIKIRRPESKIILGGPLLPYLNANGVLEDEVFSCVDHYVIGEGEIPLLAFSLRKYPDERKVTCVDSGAEPMQNVSIKDVKKSCPSFELDPIDLQDVSIKDVMGACPSFELHPMELYFSNLFVVPYLTTRKCYWNKCKFCSLSRTPSYIPPKKTQQIVDDIEKLYKAYASPYFMFNDSSMPIETFKSLGKELKRRKLNIFWSALLRFDNRLNFEDFANAYASGCRLIQFGLESGSQRLLDQMKKGIRIEKAEQILHWCKDLGIFINCFLFVGFPTETRADVEQTMTFLKRNSHLIGNLAIGPFRLERLTEVYDDWKKHNIISIENQGLELTPYVNFSLRDTSLNYNFQEFEKMFLEEFRHAPFLGLNLPDMDDYQQFFHSVCNKKQSIISYSEEIIQRTKKFTKTILSELDFNFTVGNGTLSVQEYESSGTWIINYEPMPFLRQVNTTYAAVVKMMLSFDGVVRFSVLLNRFCQHFHIDQTIGNRDLRYVLLDLYQKECLSIVP
jgi:radical SAM superfamily enzyme YgiQ (UPF0313 family)